MVVDIDPMIMIVVTKRQKDKKTKRQKDKKTKRQKGKKAKRQKDKNTKGQKGQKIPKIPKIQRQGDRRAPMPSAEARIRGPGAPKVLVRQIIILITESHQNKLNSIMAKFNNRWWDIQTLNKMTACVTSLSIA